MSSKARLHTFYALFFVLFILVMIFAHYSLDPLVVEDDPDAPQVASATNATCCGDEALLRYYFSGSYDRNVEQAVELATMRFESVVAEGLPDGSAVVFDIDDTALSTWPILEEGRFCWYPERFEEFVESRNAPRMAPVFDLFMMAIDHGVEVFFITAREEEQRSATERNLEQQGFTGFSRLIMKPVDWDGSTAEFKTRARADIARSGYQIIMNVGDQMSDLIGGYAGFEILIPNPFYTTDWSSD